MKGSIKVETSGEAAETFAAYDVLRLGGVFRDRDGDLILASEGRRTAVRIVARGRLDPVIAPFYDDDDEFGPYTPADVTISAEPA